MISRVTVSKRLRFLRKIRATCLINLSKGFKQLTGADPQIQDINVKWEKIVAFKITSIFLSLTIGLANLIRFKLQ